MKYVKVVNQTEGTRFLIKDDVNLSRFKSTMMELGLMLGSNVEWIAMPEAEIGRTKLGTREIYAKLDFTYGLELSCTGFTDDEIFQIEAVLMAK